MEIAHWRTPAPNSGAQGCESDDHSDRVRWRLGICDALPTGVRRSERPSRMSGGRWACARDLLTARCRSLAGSGLERATNRKRVSTEGSLGVLGPNLEATVRVDRAAGLPPMSDQRGRGSRDGPGRPAPWLMSSRTSSRAGARPMRGRSRCPGSGREHDLSADGSGSGETECFRGFGEG